MGLDILGLSKLEKIEDESEMYDVDIQPDDFNYFLRKVGKYISEGERYSFRAGSYSSYNVVRDIISKVIIGTTIESASEFFDCVSPIKYLVYFSDCNGIIDAPFCKGIAEEIETYKAEIAIALMAHGYDLEDAEEYIAEYIKTFSIGADDGVVIFC